MFKFAFDSVYLLCVARFSIDASVLLVNEQLLCIVLSIDPHDCLEALEDSVNSMISKSFRK